MVMYLTPIFSVSEFNELIHEHLSLIGRVTVEGEISQISVKQRNLIFITLKDDSASLDVFGLVHQLHNVDELSEGMKVSIVGTVGLYKKNSRLRLLADSVSPRGAGALKVAFERLRLKLSQEGLFDPAHKQPLPAVPTNIGLITSKGSSAYYDVVKVLGARMPDLNVKFIPVSVQGDRAVPEILKGLSYVSQHASDFEIVILARGGGSAEDLVAFNDERIVRAIFACPVPMISAIGHEDDLLLSDEVADVRASTPSNAAELAVPSFEALFREVVVSVDRIGEYLLNQVDQEVMHVHRLLSVVDSNLKVILSRIHLIEYQIKGSLEAMNVKVEHYRDVSTDYYKRIQLSIMNMLRQRQQSIALLNEIVRSYDYEEMLRRGYAIVRNADNVLVRSVVQASVGERHRIQLVDGVYETEVTYNDTK